MYEEPYKWVEAVGNRRTYLDEQFREGTPVVGVAYEHGILLMTMSKGTPKLYEIYDLLALGGMGHPADLEKLRFNLLEMAHVEGFNRSASDVTGSRLVKYGIAPVIKQAFEEVFKAPFIVKILLAEIGRTQRLEIVNALKRSRGLSVNELVDRMRMSYMGIKQHCLTLQRDGYLDTWRRPQKMGRPEMVYRLTRRTQDLFQADSNRFTLELLDSVQGIYGPNAPEKLLYNLFERKCASLKEKVKGATVAERAKSLAKIRDTEGYMSQFTIDDGGPQILECHTPLQNVLDKYPIIGRLEQEMFEQLLGTRVRRQETRNSGLYECAFYFDA